MSLDAIFLPLPKNFEVVWWVIRASFIEYVKLRNSVKLSATAAG